MNCIALFCFCEAVSFLFDLAFNTIAAMAIVEAISTALFFIDLNVF